MNKPNENDDLWLALDSNHPGKFEPEDVIEIIAEVPGANDDLSWWWVLKLKNKKYVLLSVSRDHTGWSCYSTIDFEDIYTTALEAAKSSPESEECSLRSIRLNLTNQLSGKFPKFTYWGDGRDTQ